MVDDEAVLPVAMLVEDLQSDDVHTRVNSTRKLTTIALALGPERTRDELIPFINECGSDEDEVLMALAEQLGSFVPLVGGHEHASCLLQALETLAAAEETIVREKAVRSILDIIPKLTIAVLEKQYVSMVRNLAAGEWFHSRISACSLIHAAYGGVKDTSVRQELRVLFKSLCTDETPMVRRAAASNFGKVVKVVELDYVKHEFLSVLIKLNQDDQDSVRLLAVEAMISTAELLNSSDQQMHIVPLIKASAEDKSWRVRYMLGDMFTNLQKAVGQDHTMSLLVQIYQGLLKDIESEVRAITASKLSLFCAELPVEVRQTVIVERLLPVVKELVNEGNAQVKTNLASVVMCLSPLVGRDNTMEHLLPLFLEQLKDDNPDVRLNIITNLDSVNEVIGVKSLNQSLLPAIVQLASDRKWRVRLAIIEHMPLLAGQLGQQFFDEKLSSLCMQWLEDSVYAIREAAVRNVRDLVEKFGCGWAQTNVLPKVLQLSKHQNYLHRLICILTLHNLIEVSSQDVIRQTLLPTLVGLASDPVPNVRFKVAQTLSRSSAKIDAQLLNQHVKGTLEKLNHDADPDVVYYAKEAMLKLKIK